MRAIDTNILVRAIARDDKVQAEAADTVIATGTVLVLPTVLIETEWVLRSHYRFSRRRIFETLMALCSQGGIIVDSEGPVLAALTAYAQAGDFADLLHAALAAEAGAQAMVTFDRRFAVPPAIGLALEIL